jgi:hypothetical protein
MTIGHSWYASTFHNGYQWRVPFNPPIESGVPPICKVGITDQKWQDPCAVHLRFTSHSPKYPIMSIGEKEFIWFGWAPNTEEATVGKIKPTLGNSTSQCLLGVNRWASKVWTCGSYPCVSKVWIGHWEV